MRVLTWNLYHGRSRPSSGRPLLNEFAAALDGWSWDVALLQEVPPWWPGPLAAAAGASARTALTSRNQLLPLRRAIAARNPDLITAHGGGCNAILVRGGAVTDHRVLELTRRPERRVAHGVALGAAGWVVNLHASTHPPEQVAADVAAAAAAARRWSAGAPLVLGGDLNTTAPDLPDLVHVAGHHVDHVLTDGGGGTSELLDAGPLSDHRPLRADVRGKGDSPP